MRWPILAQRSPSRARPRPLRAATARRPEPRTGAACARVGRPLEPGHPPRGHPSRRWGVSRATEPGSDGPSSKAKRTLPVAGRRPREARKPWLALISLLGCLFCHAILFTRQNSPGKTDTVYYLFPTDGETETQRSEGAGQVVTPRFQPKPTDQSDCTPSCYSWPFISDEEIEVGRSYSEAEEGCCKQVTHFVLLWPSL